MSLSLLLLISMCTLVSCQNRILGGKDAKLGQFPYQAQIMKNGRRCCGGSIINSRWILTAAHCVFDLGPNGDWSVADKNHFRINVGIVDLRAIKPENSYKVAKIITHEKFNRDSNLHHDIALIKVEKDIKFDEHTKNLKLCSKPKFAAGFKLTLAGWGHIGCVGEGSNILQYAQFTSMNNTHCQELWKEKIITDSQICTKRQRDVGPRYGDSGGPLVYQGYQIGITSYGGECGTYKPDVFTRACSYYNWILYNIQNN